MGSRAEKRASVHGLSWCRRLTNGFIALLLSMFILICTPYQGITEVKYSLFLIVCGGYLALLIVSVVELMAIGQLRPRELHEIIKRQRTVWVLAGIYLLFTTISALLAMASALFYAAAFFEKGRARALDIALLFLTGFTLFAIRVAAGILAFIVTVLAATPLMLRKKHGELWKKFAVLEAALVLLALLAVFLFDFGGSGTLHELHELLRGRPDPSFGSGRFKIWSEVISAMKGHLLWGTGPDSMQAWELPGFTRYIESLDVTIESGIDVAHNEYLNVAAQQGLLASAAFLSLLLLSLAKALRRTGESGVMLPLCAATAYLVQALFGFSMCMTAPLFWAFLGLSISREESGDLYARNT